MGIAVNNAVGKEFNFFFNEMRPSRKKIVGIVVNNAVGKDIPFYQVNEKEKIIARASVASESNTNLAMHLGAIPLWISRLHA